MMVVSNLKVDKKIIKKVEELNKVMRRMCKVYCLFGDGIALPYQNSKVIDIGYHFAQSETIQEIVSAMTNSGFLILNGVKISEVFKDYKKSEIEEIVVDNNLIKIKVSTDKKELNFVIGEISDSIIPNIYFKVKEKIKQFKQKSIKMSDEATQTLLDGEILIHQYEDFRIKMSKELLPTLKNSSDIWFLFSEINEEIFEAVLMDEDNSISSFHLYSCIKMPTD
jgi:hypothetical protein